MNKMKKKRVWIILLLISLLLLTGCDRFNLRKTSTETAGGGILTDKVYIGTQGITMDFMKDLPPSRLYDTTNINMLIEINNKGAYKTNGKIYLGGHDKNLIRGIDTEKSFGPLEGRTKYNTEGEMETIEFSSSSINLPTGTDVYEPTLIATMCYEYQTLSNAIVCIDPKFYDISIEEKACVPRDVPMGSGQGGPVSVSAVRVNTIGDKAHFKIEVNNAGKGKVIRIHECPFDLEYDDLNKAKYYVTLSGKRPEKCSPSNEVRLINGKATIFCTFVIPSENKFAYQTPLEIKLDYGYMESISKKVEIIKVPT